MSSWGLDFLKGCPKPCSDPGALPQLQGLSAQQKEEHVDNSWSLWPSQLSPSSVLHISFLSSWETSAPGFDVRVEGGAGDSAVGGGSRYK